MGDLATLPTFQPAPAGYTAADFNAIFAALTIKAGAVNANAIADGSITLAKLGNLNGLVLQTTGAGPNGSLFIRNDNLNSLSFLVDQTISRIGFGTEFTTAGGWIAKKTGVASILDANTNLQVRADIAPTVGSSYGSTVRVTLDYATGLVTFSYGASVAAPAAYNPLSNNTAALTLTDPFGGGVCFKNGTGSGQIWLQDNGTNLFVGMGTTVASTRVLQLNATSSYCYVPLAFQKPGGGMFIVGVNEGANTYNALASVNAGNTAFLPLTIHATATTYDGPITVNSGATGLALGLTATTDAYMTVNSASGAAIAFLQAQSSGGLVRLGSLTNQSVQVCVNNAAIMTVATAGVTAPTFNATSARRFKKNVQPLEAPAALDIVRHLRPVIYDEIRKDGGSNLVGFIAEEMDEVLPGMVARDAKGHAEAINYGPLVAVMAAAIKELTGRLDRLERSAA